MSETLEPLVRDLVTWCASAQRSYTDVLDAWRTSCPRLTVWEEAVARGLLETQPSSSGLVVVVTEAGRSLAGSVPPQLAPHRAPRAAAPRVAA